MSSTITEIRGEGLVEQLVDCRLDVHAWLDDPGLLEDHSGAEDRRSLDLPNGGRGQIGPLQLAFRYLSAETRGLGEDGLQLVGVLQRPEPALLVGDDDRFHDLGILGARKSRRR